MSLTTNLETNLMRPSAFMCVKQQVAYKLRVHAGLFLGLVILQVIFIAFNLFGADETITMSLNNVHVQVDVYQIGNILGVTLIWAFIAGATLAGRKTKQTLHSLVVDNKSNHLSNGILLVLMSVVAGVTIPLSSIAIWVGAVAVKGVEGITFVESFLVTDFYRLFPLAFLYMLLMFTISYFIASCVQLPRSMLIFIVLSIGILVFVMTILHGIFGIMEVAIWEVIPKVLFFYFDEPNLLVFSGRALLTSCFIFLLTIVLTSRQEAR